MDKKYTTNQDDTKVPQYEKPMLTSYSIEQIRTAIGPAIGNRSGPSGSRSIEDELLGD